ncbi:unnamed protein product [Euphydryas editha]|uniref:Uncharacterized protein n=1 Tax=Euphydryas editha TaxID=104508 RepID=A0AAU9THV1_EUPED|nr:unnamed protein product [Euphydryas editha]
MGQLDTIGQTQIDTDGLMRELGQNRRFHLKNYALLALVTFSLAHYGVNYVFLVADVPYRCMIPECEAANSTVYNPPWLDSALPEGGRERRCSSKTPLAPEQDCGAGAFSDELRPCEHWLYASRDTIVAEFNLACQDWKRTLVGTIHNIGTLVSLPILGYVSDRRQQDLFIQMKPFTKTVSSLRWCERKMSYH